MWLISKADTQSSLFGYELELEFSWIIGIWFKSCESVKINKKW